MDHTTRLRARADASWLGRALPRGGELPPDVWRARHRGILVLLWLHLPVIAAMSVGTGTSAEHATTEVGMVAGLAVLATMAGRHPRLSTVITAVGLLSCSAVMVHLTGGLIEMHFHYFVMVGVITLYQDWRPFLVAIGYVVLQHGVAGALWPEAVYNHQAAVVDPWTWATVHGLFILGMSAAGLVSWRLNESLLAATREREEALRSREVALTGALSLLSATLDATTDGILVVDNAGAITSHNQRFVEMWSIPDHVLDSGDDDLALAHAVHQLVDPDSFMERVRALYSQPGAESHDTLQFSDGRVVERYSRPQLVDGEIVGRVWSFRDVTERTRLEGELAHQAFHDSLTGLANQVLFRDRVGHALELTPRSGGDVGVLFFDLDDFKNVNDSLGHTAGDELLVEISHRVQTCLRDGDTAARLGGDEFAVLIEQIHGHEDATATASRLLDAIRAPITVAGREVVISASIGIAVGGDSSTTDQLLRDADLAMYTAKRNGKGQFQVYAATMHEAALERLELESDLRRAFAEGGLHLHYQPIVDLRTGVIAGVEALLRWDHPRRGPISPAVFIELAEHCGLITDLGRWVLAEACGQVQRWQQLGTRAGGPIGLAVNLSPHQLGDAHLVGELAAILERTGLPASSLTLEITEGAMMGDPDVALERLTELSDLGIRLAVDDFGTGYSSLSYLQRFPIDVLKIDRSFVQRLDQGPEESSLARAIVRLAHTLHLEAVAEGIEDWEQLRHLRQLGCEYAQGFLLCRPQPPAEVEALLATGTTFQLDPPLLTPA